MNVAMTPLTWTPSNRHSSVRVQQVPNLHQRRDTSIRLALKLSQTLLAWSRQSKPKFWTLTKPLLREITVEFLTHTP